MPDLADLFTPIKLRNTVIRNRIVQSAHITGYVENGLPSDRHVRYYEARAKGGIGLIITEAVAISSLTDVKPEISVHGDGRKGSSRARGRSPTSYTPTAPRPSCRLRTAAA